MGFVNEIQSHKYRTWKAICTSLLFSGLGLHSASFGPALIDFMIQVGTSIDKITYILPTRAFGNMMGSVACGFVLAYLDHQIVLISSMFAMSLSILFVPLCFQLWQLNICMIINGISGGFLVNAGNCFVIHKWGKENSPFMQMAHFMFGAGAFFSPFIVEPFLGDFGDIEEFASSSNTTIASNTTDLDIDKTSLVFDPRSLHLKYAYFIIGALSFFFWILFVLTYLNKRDNKPHPSREVVKKVKTEKNVVTLEIVRSEDDTSDGEVSIRNKTVKAPSKVDQSVLVVDEKIKPYHKVVLVLLAAVFIHLAYGIELSFGVMLASFARLSSLQLSKTSASYVTSLYWGCFTFFRLCTLVLINFISARSMLIIDLVLIMLGNLVLLPFLFVPDYNEFALWLGSALMGIGVSSIYPTLWSFLEEILPVTSKMTSVVNSTACFGEFIVPVIIGAYIETWPNVFIVIVFIYSLLASLIFALSVLWEMVINKHKRS